MNSFAMAQAVQQKVRPRFRGQQNMLPRVPMHFPMNLEREYIRIVNAYMTLLYKTLARYLPKIRRAVYDDSKTTRYDSVDDVISETFTQMQIAFEEQARNFALERRLTTLAEQTRRVSVAEWRRVVRSSLGVNIMEDYYMGEFFRSLLQQWVTRNVDLISTVPKSTLTEIRNIVESSWQSGALTRDIARWMERHAFPFDPGSTPVTRAMMAHIRKTVAVRNFGRVTKWRRLTVNWHSNSKRTQVLRNIFGTLPATNEYAATLPGSGRRASTTNWTELATHGITRRRLHRDGFVIRARTTTADA